MAHQSRKVSPDGLWNHKTRHANGAGGRNGLSATHLVSAIWPRKGSQNIADNRNDGNNRFSMRRGRIRLADAAP